MPWEERSLMDVRLRFVQDVHRPGWSVAEVCRRYQVSRKTGYKWLERYEKAGPAGLGDRSHRPYSCPHATPAAGPAPFSRWAARDRVRSAEWDLDRGLQRTIPDGERGLLLPADGP